MDGMTINHIVRPWLICLVSVHGDHEINLCHAD